MNETARKENLTLDPFRIRCYYSELKTKQLALPVEERRYRIKDGKVENSYPLLEEQKE